MEGLQCGDFFVITPMKYGNSAKDGRLTEMMTSCRYALQEKKDGVFYQLMKNKEGEIALFSRTVSKTDGLYVNKIENVPHIKEWAQCLPNDTTLLGEIYVKGGTSKDVVKVMGALPEKAQERQYDSDDFGGPVYFYVFDCIKHKGEYLLDQPFSYRMGTILGYHLYDLFLYDPHVELAVTYTLDGADEFETPEDTTTFQGLLNDIFAANGEGAVIKALDGMYVPGKRPTYNNKIKTKADNIDLTIIKCLDPEVEYKGKDVDSWRYWGLFENTNTTERPVWTLVKRMTAGDEDFQRVDTPVAKMIPLTKHYYYGWKNTVEVGAYDENGVLVSVGRVAAGFTDEDRAAMGKNPDSFIGRTIEVQAMSVDKDEKTLRHGFFVCWRDDKPAEDCLLADIF